MSPADASLAYALPALLLTVIGMRLRRASRDPKTSHSDAVLVDLGLGLATVIALVLWLRVFLSLFF